MRKLIGKGAFTRAYQIALNQVEVISSCPAKECYAMFSQGNPFAPTIEHVGQANDGKGIFHMPLYPKMKSIKTQFNTTALHVYRQLRRLELNADDYQTFCKMVENLELTQDQKDDIISLASDVCNAIDCRDMRFEISPRNVSCDSDGNLVMLDCFFSMKELCKVRGWF
ncbi:hypothetical protein phiPsa267_170 [Pseudomonas phage phiPsa267]|uniref:Uncharacterized protein n=2 Tax=Otagovirus TaxID=2560197 RepID=A0A7G9V0V4_9CAUD|nr:hypothetical protein QGX19_gp060 [Pseudomonas phage phiPsa267]YP_010767951.1 hypothetical protein QGX20_gp057 [Pseudomonas phage phiPsa300]QNN99909.1 hypothetical protein phiPsa267_170 [Pseudomonas phage phiPsa267]QNO00085.1 hypothetical protein phiPsa300_165 [Pseudomonas phage phiPsa300]